MNKTLIIGTISIFILLLFYVFQVNAMIFELSLAQECDKKSKSFYQEQEELQISFSQTHSLENLEGLVSQLDFEKVNEISYIQALETSVAIK